MSNAGGNGTRQSQDQAAQPPIGKSFWDQTQPSAQGKLSSQGEDVSPRSKGATALTDKQIEEMRRKLEDAKARASSPAVLHRASTEPSRPSPEQAALKSVSPELLTELRKIIREEFESLKGDPKARADGADEKPSPPPSAARERPSSPVQPFMNAAGVFVHTYPARGTEDKAAARPTSSPTKTSPTWAEQKESPRASTVRFSDETKPAEPLVPPRPEEAWKAPEVELTAIDMRWGVLFGKDGSHTKRMEQVIRGLANYMVEEFMPQRSIVITPEKMAAFYSHHRIDKETFPFAALFKSRSKDFNEALESLYEDLGCQYFLVQAAERHPHNVPALTPQGFMHWLVTMIQAYPDEEAKRLDKVVSALPLEADSLLDGKLERLPKQISRYLLPKEPVRAVKRRADDALKYFKEDLERSPSQSSTGKAGGSKSTPIIVTATPDKRASASAAASGTSRYVPDRAATKEAEQASSDRRPSAVTKDMRDDDKHRRGSVPAPSGPGKLGRSGSIAETTRSSQSSRDPHRDMLGRAPSSASNRKNRSPQRNPHSVSAPSGMDRDDVNAERHRSSGNIPAAAATAATATAAAAAAANAAHGVGSGGYGASASTQTLAKEPGDKGMRDARTADYFGPCRSKRASLDDSTPRAAASGPRNKILDAESSGSSGTTSRSGKRRSMVLPDTSKRPTWDDYLKSSAPRNSTPGFHVNKSSTG